MKAMILAAGLGTRLKPFTDHHPKALALVNGKSLLQRNIEYLTKHGITEIIVNVHHFPDQIEKHIQELSIPIKIHLSDERDEVLETGGGLKKASWFFTSERDSFVLMNVDILTDLNLSQLIQYHRQHAALATLAVCSRSSSRYFLFDESNRLCGWRNAKTGDEKIVIRNHMLTEMAFSGIHVIRPEIFSLIQQEGKFSMVDVYLSLASQYLIEGYDHSGSVLLDVGKPGSVEEAETLFK